MWENPNFIKPSTLRVFMGAFLKIWLPQNLEFDNLEKKSIICEFLKKITWNSIQKKNLTVFV